MCGQRSGLVPKELSEVGPIPKKNGIPRTAVRNRSIGADTDVAGNASMASAR
jgi:hypothetical protein